MKVLSIILKIVETGIVCVWGVFFGVLFPVFIMVFGADIVPSDIAARTDIMTVWLISSLVYVLSAAFILSRHYRIAAVMSAAGLVGILIVNGMFDALYVYTVSSSGPDELYLPLIFATILDILILAVEERANIAKLLEAKKAEKEEQAPSILGDSEDGR